MRYKIYALYDENGDCVFKGTRDEVCSAFYINRVSIYEYLRQPEVRKINGKYIIRRTAENAENLKQVDKRKIPKNIAELKKKKELEYLLFHLRYYGNTVCRFDPTPYLKTVKQEIGYGISKRYDKKQKHYYLEVVR